MNNQSAKAVGKAAGKAVGKAIVKGKIKEKARELLDAHGDKVTGFMGGAAVTGGAQVNWDNLHRPTGDEVPEVFREIHEKAFPTPEPPTPSVPDSDGDSIFSDILSFFFR